MLSESLLRRRLEERGLSPRLILLSETGSTNDDAKALARENPPSPVLIAASRQTGGRGRRGRTFLSPEGGLYLSLLIPLPPDCPPSRAVGSTGCAAVAACRSVEECAGIPAKIKWVNDILVTDPVTGRTGKAAGILCETVTREDTAPHLVIGIGLNLTSAPDLPDANYPAARISSPSKPVEPESLCASLTEGFLALAENRFDFRSVADEYRSRSAVLGQEIVFQRDGTAREGVALSVLDDGSLLVGCADGTRVLLDSGEISVRQKQGGRSPQ